MGTDEQRRMAKSRNSKGKDLLKCIQRMGVGVCDGDRVVVLPAANGKCYLYRTTPTPSEDTLQSLFHRVNEFHANVGVELKALPEIKSIEWDVEGKECVIPLSMLPSYYPTVGDLKQAIINSVRYPSHVKYNLVINTPGGDIWRQQNDTDDKLLIQELGLPGPSLHATISAENVDFPNIGGLRWVIDEKEYHVPLSIVSADLPTVGDVRNALFRNAHQTPSGCKGDLVLTAVDGSTWYQHMARDRKLLIQELGLPGPVVKVTLSNEKYEIFVETLTGKRFACGVHAFTTVDRLKILIEEKAQIPSDQQRLIHNGKQLEDGHTMHDYGILQKIHYTSYCASALACIIRLLPAKTLPSSRTRTRRRYRLPCCSPMVTRPT
jgi:hypothetical protein